MIYRVGVLGQPIPIGPPWYKPDSKPLTSHEYAVLFDAALHEGIFRLHSCDRLNGVSSTDRLRTRFRKSEMLDLTLRDKLFHGTCHLFDRDVRIGAVLLE